MRSQAIVLLFALSAAAKSEQVKDVFRGRLGDSPPHAVVIHTRGHLDNGPASASTCVGTLRLEWLSSSDERRIVDLRRNFVGARGRLTRGRLDGLVTRAVVRNEDARTKVSLVFLYV